MAKKVESKLEIKAEGKLGLGTADPNAKLDIKLEAKLEPRVKKAKEEQPLGHTTRAFRQ